MIKPIGVIINDIHYNRDTLEIADACLNMAIDTANSLKVPLIIAGDLHDTKANLRAECVNRIIKTLERCDSPPYIVVGNHDKINEKSIEHALNFLYPFGMVIEKPTKQPKFYIIPYHHDLEELRTYIKTIPKGSIVIMHQGLQGTNAGEYYRDLTALNHDDVAGLRVISGHYHYSSDTVLPDGGLWTFTGNPYTLNFGEANDPVKGYHVLYADGSLELQYTNQRRHIVYEINLTNNYQPATMNHNEVDLVRLKVTGTKEQLSTFKKPFECRMDLIPTDASELKKTISAVNNEGLLDELIDGLSVSESRKLELKGLWRQLNESPERKSK